MGELILPPGAAKPPVITRADLEVLLEDILKERAVLQSQLQQTVGMEITLRKLLSTLDERA